MGWREASHNEALIIDNSEHCPNYINKYNKIAIIVGKNDVTYYEGTSHLTNSRKSHVGAGQQPSWLIQ